MLDKMPHPFRDKKKDKEHPEQVVSTTEQEEQEMRLYLLTEVFPRIDKGEYKLRVEDGFATILDDQDNAVWHAPFQELIILTQLREKLVTAAEEGYIMGPDSSKEH